MPKLRQTLVAFLLFAALVLPAQTDSFNRYLDSLKQILPPQPDTTRLRVLNQISKAYITIAQRDSALLYINRSLDLALTLGYKRGLATAYLHKGVFEISGYKPLDKATGYLLKSLQLFNTLQDNRGIAQCNLQLGVLSFDMESYEDAIKYLNKTLAFEKQNLRLRATAHYLLALCYSEMHAFEKALEMFDLARQVYGDSNEQMALQIETFKGKLYTNKGDYASAIAQLELVLSTYASRPYPEDLAPTRAFLATAYYHSGRLEKAIKQARMAYQLANGRGSYLIYLREAEETLHKAYRDLGNTDSAYYFLAELSQIKDSIYNNRVLQRVAVMKGVYDFEQILESNKAEAKLKDAVAKQRLERERTLRNFFVVCLLLVIVFAIVFFKQRNKIAAGKKRSDELLRNILPFETAEELKATGTAEAKQIELASVLFTDFVGFTEIAEKLSPHFLVQEINVYFSAFDSILDQYGIEKIKTIGDAYMAAGGLPVPKNDSVKNTVFAALAIQDYIKKALENADDKDKVAFKMRVGIHTGPVVAGIVGLKKFQYDIWGDTVNTANRMEEYGEAGKVNISGFTYDLIKNEPEFAFEYRGKVHVKGKGEVDMYFVERKIATA